MRQQAFQHGEIRDENDNILYPGTYGKKTPFATGTNDGILDYIINNFEALYEMAEGAFLPFDNLSSFPGTGIPNKFYLAKDTGKVYRWDGSGYVEANAAVDGKSAYELAVDHGYKGTEEEWLASLGIASAEVDSNGNLVLKTSGGVSVQVPLKPLEEAAKYKDEAKVSADNAGAAETAATSAKQAAEASETAAASSEKAAETAKAEAVQSAALAQKWAESDDSPDGSADADSGTGKTQSAKSWAKESATSKTAAESASTEAAKQAESAGQSAAAAETSKTNAAGSEQAAAQSEKNAKTSETAAASSAGAAAKSAEEAKKAVDTFGTVVSGISKTGEDIQVTKTDGSTEKISVNGFNVIQLKDTSTGQISYLYADNGGLFYSDTDPTKGA